MALEVSQATEADLERLMEIQFSAFAGEPYHDVIFGLNTAANRAAEGAQLLKAWRADPYLVVLKAVRPDTGTIVAVGRWNMYTTERPESEWRKREPMDWLEGRRREIAEYFFGRFADARERLWEGRPYILLGFLATHADYQGQGAGTAILKWGLDRADELGLPVYLEATEAGEPLYQKLGFRKVGELVYEKDKWDGDHDRRYSIMVRGKGTG